MTQHAVVSDVAPRQRPKEGTRAVGYTVTQVDDTARAEWDAYVGNAPGAELYHDYRWRLLLEGLFGHESLYLMARDGSGHVCGVLPLIRLKSRIFGDFLVSMPYVNYGGLLVDGSAEAEALIEKAENCARELCVGHIELRHRDTRLVDWPAREDKVALRLELPGSEEALWKGFKPKLRAQIRRPGKEGAIARVGGVELLEDFYHVFSRNMRDLGTPVYSKAFFKSILTVFCDEAEIHIVRLHGHTVAAGIVLAHRDTMEIPWASSLRGVKRTGVNMLLYWSVLSRAVERGFRCFDFGRSTKGSGTYRFKQQWGARPQQLLWHYWLSEGRALPRLTPTNPKYRAAIAIWRKLPLAVANLLGPRIVKNLP